MMLLSKETVTDITSTAMYQPVLDKYSAYDVTTWIDLNNI